MLTPEFASNIEALLERSRGQRAALMCAEAVPWRCHRSLIADYLVAGGVPVEHIVTASRVQPHMLRDWARVEGSRAIYPLPEAA